MKVLALLLTLIVIVAVAFGGKPFCGNTIYGLLTLCTFLLFISLQYSRRRSLRGGSPLRLQNRMLGGHGENKALLFTGADGPRAALGRKTFTHLVRIFLYRFICQYFSKGKLLSGYRLRFLGLTNVVSSAQRPRIKRRSAVLLSIRPS